jgi:hypothetical protein
VETGRSGDQYSQQAQATVAIRNNGEHIAGKKRSLCHIVKFAHGDPRSSLFKFKLRVSDQVDQGP